MEINQKRENSGIRIDLTKQNSVIYPQESLFQKSLYDKLNVLLDVQWSFLQSMPEEQKRKISQCRIHNAILVYGERGSGKTVFISNIESNVKENHYEFLDIIDPTLLSDSKVIDDCEAFCSILVGIVHEHLKEKVFSKNSVCEHDKNTYTKIFREVADCLSSLKNAKDESGLDSIFFHGNAIALEQKLHEFFQVVSKTLLNGKMLCFRLDDVDMSFKSGFLCLETMRKYFSSPWVIPIVCGDIHLYQQLVSKEYLSSFSKFYDSNKEAGVREGENFSSKYLVKIFPNNLRLEIVSCANLVSREYNPISFVFHGKDGLIEFHLKDIDDYIDTYFNPGIGLDQYKNNVLSSFKRKKVFQNIVQDPFCFKREETLQNIVQESLRVWIQFHEKMFPIYNKIAQTKGIERNFKFDGSLYSQFQESLADFFDSHQKFQIISKLARININSLSSISSFNYNYQDALTALSEAEDLLICSEGENIFSDRGLRLSRPSPNDIFFEDNKEREMFLFLLQLFSFDNSKEETGKSLEVISGRFVHLVFSTLFHSDCNIGEILFETPPFCSFVKNAAMPENNDDNDEDAQNDLLPLLTGEKADDLWEEIVNKYPYVNGDSKPFFDINFLRGSLALYYDNLNDYRKRKYENESILDYMMRCVAMLLHSVYMCERKDFITYKKVALTKDQNNFWGKNKEKISPSFSQEIFLLTEGNMGNSISYYLFHHPLIQLINAMALKYSRWKNNQHEAKSCLPIIYLKQGISENAVRQSIEIASSLDEINNILKSVDKQTLTAISKFTPRSNAFKRIKILYCTNTTSEGSKALYDKLCRTNGLTNLVPTSPAWEKCVTND